VLDAGTDTVVVDRLLPNSVTNSPGATAGEVELSNVAELTIPDSVSTGVCAWSVAAPSIQIAAVRTAC
jgi:hypothetical protein